MKNKRYWIVTSIVTLLPMLVGLLLWDQLPEKLPTHFGPSGTADGWSGKGFAVFGLPLMFLAFQWIICAVTKLDKQNQGHNRKVLDLVGLIFPAMSVFFGLVIYSHGLGLEVEFARILFVLLGLLFVLMGNWLPKIRQNSTLGIKLKWTLYNEDNWNRTHRIGGYTWVLGGLVFIVMGFVSHKALLWLMPANLVVMVGVPTIYSWNLARKQKAQGTYTESQVNKNLKKHPVIMTVSMILAAVILIILCVILFTGDIECTVTADTLTIDADYWDDQTIPLDTVDSIEFRPDGVDGTREWGWGSARLLLGFFQNEEFGNYTRYTYTGDSGCIVLWSGDNALVLALKEEPDTLALYEQLRSIID